MSDAAHILLIEDESQLAKFIEMELNAEGYKTTVCQDGMTGIATARSANPDLIISDWMLPGMTGPEIIRRLRQTGDKVPIMLLTAKDAVNDRVEGLDSGANDYLIKPFSIEELLARVRVLLRHLNEEDPDVLQFADLCLNQLSREVTRGGRPLELTAKEFDLLVYLMHHPKQVLTRDQILEEVWGYDFMGDSNIIEVYIRYLRLKLETEDEKRIIHTVRGVGYVLRD